MGLEQLQFFVDIYESAYRTGEKAKVHILFIVRNDFEALCKRRFDAVKLTDHKEYEETPCMDCDDIMNFRRSHR